MSTQQMLCGDEVNSIVLDIGTCHTRMGFAGQDSPKCVFKSSLCEYIDESNEKKYNLGEPSLRYVRPNYDIRSYTEDDVEKIINYGVRNLLSSDPSQYALFFGQGSLFRELPNQEKLVETCFESLGVPAMYLMPNSVLSSISSGRQTSLVVDFGSHGTTVDAIYEGYELRRCKLTAPQGGNTVDQAIETYLQTNNIPLNPWYYKTTKPAIINQLNASYSHYHKLELIRDIKQWMCFLRPSSNPIPPTPATPAAPAAPVLLPPDYELPDGTFVKATEELCYIAESVYFYKENISSQSKPTNLVDNDSAMDIEQPEQKSSSSDHFSQFPSIPQIMYKALGQAEVDIRKQLFSNVVLVGGGSLLSGINLRCTNELQEILPSYCKVKTVFNSPLERQHSAWIGGSILSICGTFNQMWLSKEEYEEQGSRIILERFQH